MKKSQRLVVNTVLQHSDRRKFASCGARQRLSDLIQKYLCTSTACALCTLSMDMYLYRSSTLMHAPPHSQDVISESLVLHVRILSTPA